MIKTIFLTIWAAACVAAFVVCAYDKLCAVRGRRRVSEKTLLLSALFFGACGTLTAMLVFSHKTQKPKFMIWVPAMAVLHIVFAARFLKFFV